MTESNAYALAATLVLGALLSAGCGGQATSFAAHPRLDPFGQIQTHEAPDGPRLTLVSRDGDLSSAVAVAVLVDGGSMVSAALSALVESRLERAGLPVDAHVDAIGFRLRRHVADATEAGRFFDAVVTAMRLAVTPSDPALAAVELRLTSLRRNPMDAPIFKSIQSCTGQLGVLATESFPTPDRLPAELETWRKRSLVGRNVSVSAVGPSEFCVDATATFSTPRLWPSGPAAAYSWPPGDTSGAYTTIQDPSQSDRGQGFRLHVAVRTRDPEAAIATAQRFAKRDSALRSRFDFLPAPWRIAELNGVALPSGGCISIEAEPQQDLTRGSYEQSAAAAIGVLRVEVDKELRRRSANVGASEILEAADSRDAAERAAWWATVASAGAGEPRWTYAFGVPQDSAQAPSAREDATLVGLDHRIERLFAAAGPASLETRVRVERGQGEFWMLVASPCGACGESLANAGTTSLGLIAALHAADPASDVVLEPWVDKGGIGFFAHGKSHDGSSLSDLGERVASAVGRAIAAPDLGRDTVGQARALALSRLENVYGLGREAFDAFAFRLSPNNPSRVEPLGSWQRVASASVESVRDRWRTFASSSLRVAVLANADSAQAEVATRALERWLSPRVPPIERAAETGSAEAGAPCAPTAVADPKLPKGTPMAQTFIGGPLNLATIMDADAAELMAHLLNGKDGMLERVLSASPRAFATATIRGGGPNAAYVIDLRAPNAHIDEATTRVRALLNELASQGPSDVDYEKASLRMRDRRRQTLLLPQGRLVALWEGRALEADAPPKAALTQVRPAFSGGAATVVIAHPE